MRRAEGLRGARGRAAAENVPSHGWQGPVKDLAKEPWRSGGRGGEQRRLSHFRRDLRLAALVESWFLYVRGIDLFAGYRASEREHDQMLILCLPSTSTSLPSRPSLRARPSRPCRCTRRLVLRRTERRTETLNASRPCGARSRRPRSEQRLEEVRKNLVLRLPTCCGAGGRRGSKRGRGGAVWSAAEGRGGEGGRAGRASSLRRVLQATSVVRKLSSRAVGSRSGLTFRTIFARRAVTSSGSRSKARSTLGRLKLELAIGPTTEAPYEESTPFCADPEVGRAANAARGSFSRSFWSVS